VVAIARECLSDCQVLGVFDEDGYLADVRHGDGSELPHELLQCVLDLFEGVCFPSLAGTQYPINGHCWIA
jgi:hypothetical protein